MYKILKKRVFRDLKENMFRHLALGLLIILGMYIVIGLVGAADTIIRGTARLAEANHVEDGQFGVFMPLEEGERLSLEEEGIALEEHFYLDYRMEGTVLRIFSQRNKIDLVQADEGALPEKEGEIFLEKRYCEEHDIAVGDKIAVGNGVMVGNTDYTVSGIGTAPDYEAPLRNFSDSAVDSYQFGIGFVLEEDYERMRNMGGSISTEEYFYAYLLNDAMSDKQLREKLKNFEVSKMTRFVSAADNPRIGSAADDKFVDKAAGLVAGVIVLILFTYVISIFTVHSIETESGVIGTLYAMGVKSSELMLHYLTLPVAVTFLAGIMGTILGYSRFGIEIQMSQPYGYFSIPRMDVRYEPYLFLYGIVMPPLVAAFTNYFVIRKRLDRPALSLIRGSQKNMKVQKIKIKGNFVRVFRIRQFLREKRAVITVFFGMFISLLVVMLSLDCFVICSHVKTENVKDTKFEYMYFCKYPQGSVPEGGEEAYGVTMKKEALGYNFDVTLLGIHADNPYFDAEVEEGEDRVLISSAMAQKYRIHEGDDVTLFDEENDRDYTFTVEGIVTYSAGFFAFMDIDSMCRLMGESDGYYNIVFADRALDMDSGLLASVLSKSDVEKSSSVFVEQMKDMVTMLLVVSGLMFVVVMYLMMKVVIDRSAISISLFKVFGYRKKEIGKLYLNGNFYVVAISALVGIPLSKAVMDSLFPYMVANVACGINLAFSWQMYAAVFFSVLILYFMINRILMRRVNRILPTEALKKDNI